MASGSPAGGQTFEKCDKHVLNTGAMPVDTPNPFVQIFKIWPLGRAAGGIKQR